MSSHPLPVDADAERHLLGSTWSGLILNDPESRAVLWEVPPEAFFIADHRRLWAGMRALVQAGKQPSELVLAWEAYGGKPTPEQQTAVFEVLASGADLQAGPLKARVLEFASRRVAISAAREVIAAASDFAIPADEMQQRANQAFLEVSKGAGGASISRFWTAAEMVPHLASGAGFRDKAGSKKLCYFGVDWLDDLLLCTPGNVTILGGRPGAGKTGLGLQARNVSAMAGIKAGFFSLEMDGPEINARDAAWWLSDPAAGRVYAYKDFLKGHYDAARVMQVVREGIPGMDDALAWHHPSGILLGKLAAYITEAVHAHGIQLAIIDYFQYIGLQRQRGDSLASAYAANSMGIKRLAQELGIHVLLLSQLNREGDGKRPGLTDLKETSQLEQDASGVPLLYRDKDGQLCCTLPKNRDGETVVERPLDISWPCLRFKGMVRTTDGSSPSIF